MLDRKAKQADLGETPGPKIALTSICFQDMSTGIEVPSSNTENRYTKLYFEGSSFESRGSTLSWCLEHRPCQEAGSLWAVLLVEVLLLQGDIPP